LKEKTVIFDLDGTLIDSIKDIALATNIVLEELGFKKHPLDDYENFVGDGALMLLTNALPTDVNKSIIDKALVLFKKYYGDRIHKNTKPYEGIYEMLDELTKHNTTLAVLSNKPHEFTVEFIEHFFSRYPFCEVHGQKDNVPKKPDPKGAINISQALNIPENKIFFIGDTATDMKTAKNAGMTAIGVSWGYRKVDELIASGADYIAKTPEHLTQILLENNI